MKPITFPKLTLHVIQDHGDGRRADAGPLTVRLSTEAALSHPSEPLALNSRGADLVRLTSNEQRRRSVRQAHLFSPLLELS